MTYTIDSFFAWLGQRNAILYTLEPDGSMRARIEKHVDVAAERKNTYYQPARSKRGQVSKPKKADLECTKHLHVDLDPEPGLPLQEEQDRLLGLVTDDLPKGVPVPSAIILTGRGIQCLWTLEQALPLPANEQAVESANLWLMERLGAPRGTHNVDRLLRAPCTWNASSDKKRKEGFEGAECEVHELNNRAYRLEHFGSVKPKAAAGGANSSSDVDPSQIIPQPLNDLNDLDQFKLPRRLVWLISRGAPKNDLRDYVMEFGNPEKDPNDRSPWVLDVCCNLLRKNVPDAMVLGVLLDRDWGISDHIFDQKDPDAYARRQLAQARDVVDRDPVLPKVSAVTSFLMNQRGGVEADSQHNIRVALAKLSVELSYDEFSDRMMVKGLKGRGPIMQDADFEHLWLRIDREFSFRPQKDFFMTVINDTSRCNAFNPVKEYLDSLRWDGVPRIDTWLTEYGGAKDSEFCRAVSALMLIAAVRRVRQPGTQFHEVLVLQSKQGTNKSSALRTLCPNPHWFCDDIPLNSDSKTAIEKLSGRWIIECQELHGLSKAEETQVKSFLSRDKDTSRMAYGRIVKEVWRRCVFFGTTNQDKFLTDTTGNRRWWPVKVIGFDLEAIRRDRDQLWAEASHREMSGESTRLHPSLYAAAASEQEERRIEDPYVDILRSQLGDMEGIIRACDAFTLLGSRGERTQKQNARLAESMRCLGWEQAKLGSENAYSRGSGVDEITIAYRSDQNRHYATYAEGQSEPSQAAF